MAPRPITDIEWRHYEIVADIDEDAERMTVGLLVIGKAKVWIDDASLELVDNASVKVTTRSSRADSPQQPFFVSWLWLVVIVLGLFVVSQSKNSFAQRFALRFSIGYWLLYSLPTPFTGIVASILGLMAKLKIPVESTGEWFNKFVAGYTYYTERAVHWTAANVLAIDDVLVQPTGSGDTTFAYVRLLICFGGALAVAIVWSAADWRRAEQNCLRDILRTYLRYVLALTMLGYGLHKLGFIATQFATGGVPMEWQLNRTYGESSPMGL